VLNNLVDVGDVAGADFTKDTLKDPDDTTNEPVAPENSDGIEGTERRPIRLDHAEHAMQLPKDEEDDEKVVGVPEPLEVGTAFLLEGKPDHGTKDYPHKPTGDEGTNLEVSQDAIGELLTERLALSIVDGKTNEIYSVGKSMNNTPPEDRKAGGLVECDVLVERDDIVEGSATEQGDEVTADR
jgi:hypothetical protein